ncbi:MAG: Shedu immune nuclease family protein [Candidatus Acidiferrales bacterium]
MDEIQTTSTSAKTADCSPIVIRESDRVRLIFLPTMVDNSKDADACVRGIFVYQKKNKADKWIPATGHTLTSLKSGEGYKLELHSNELLGFMKALGPIYRLHRQEGIPRGKQDFIKVQAGLAPLLKLGKTELKEFLESNSQQAAVVLPKIMHWLANSHQGMAAISEVSASDLPSLTALLGLSAIKGAVKYWTANESNADEEFWQKALTERAYVLSQTYSYPVVIIKAKAYLGGKTFDDTGGKLVDFLLRAESTKTALIVEIKTPKTTLLGPKYREGVYPFSTELSGAIAQALWYQRSLGQNFQNLTGAGSKKVLLGEPRCLVIAGNVGAELKTDEMRVSFELQRELIQGVTVVGYDELFLKVKTLVELLEKTD